MMLDNKQKHYCAVILTTRSVEFQAVHQHLNNIHEEVHKGTIYERGFFSNTELSWDIGIAQVGTSNAVAASEVERAIAYFRPNVVLFVGVASGLKDVNIGDLVVATKVYGYESSKADSIILPIPEVGISTYSMQQRAKAEARNGRWLQRLEKTNTAASPRVFVAPLAAGEKVITSSQSDLGQFLQMNYSDALAVEMEGYGFLMAAHANKQVEALVIRGISKLVDEQSRVNTAQSEHIAAQHASAFAFEILSRLDVDSLDQPLNRRGSNSKVKSSEQARKGKSNDTMKKSTVNVLLACANPYSMESLRLGTEVRAIREAILLSKHRDNINITICLATTIHDLRRALLNENFHVVQISGHGSNQGLALEDESGGLYVVPQRALAKLFQSYTSIQCVILNACYSITQGNLISQVVPFTVAMEGSLNDRAAIEFARGFYDALGAMHTIEQAYEQGCLTVDLAIHNVAKFPKLLTQGKTPAVNDTQASDEEAKEDEQRHFKNVNALIGLAIDLSGSMATSIHNETGEQLSRLESVRQSFSDLTKDAQRSLRHNRTKDSTTSIETFIYGFGLRPNSIEVCDLLSLVKASRQIITKDVIEDVKRRYITKKQETYKGYKGLGGFIKSLGLGNAVSLIEDITKQNAEKTIRRYVWQEVADDVEIQLKKIGDTTLPIEDIPELWGDTEDVLSNAETLIFGSTPITEALIKIVDRFERESTRRSNDTHLILLLVSDGKYLDTDPLPLVKKLHDMGVTIYSCFVTDKDSINPRELLNQPSAEWDQETKLMFEMASFLEEDTEIERFLLNKGWTIHNHPKLFIQVNHSDVLKEFVHVVLSQLEEADNVRALPRGW